MPLLETTPTEPLFDLFASTEPTQTFLEKHLCKDEEPVKSNVYAKHYEDEKDELRLP